MWEVKWMMVVCGFFFFSFLRGGVFVSNSSAQELAFVFKGVLQQPLYWLLVFDGVRSSERALALPSLSIFSPLKRTASLEGIALGR